MSGFERKTVSEWQAEGVLRVEDGNHGENRPRKDEFADAGMAFIRAADMNDGAILFDSAEKIDERAQARVRKGIGQPGDVLISHKGTVGRVGRAPMECPPFVCSPQTTFWRVENEGRLDRGYLFSLLRSAGFQAEFAVRSGETDMAGYVSLTSQRALEITLPSIEVQREIAAILGVLDDKIELNRKTAATLEKMARALYRSWFVDFDPVHAKAAGQPPAHMDEATAALFPDRFGDDGLPEGWREETLADLIEFNPKEKLPKGTVAPYLDMKALPTTSMSAEPPINREFTSGTKFRARDTLLARITPCLENGKTAMVDELGESEIGWGSTEFIVMRAKGNVPASLPYCVARDASFREEAIGSMTGSSGRQRADAQAIAQIEAAIPCPEVLMAFSQATMPLIEKVHQLGKESQTLAALRDTLLPKLMSGEVRVGDARKQVKEAV